MQVAGNLLYLTKQLCTGHTHTHTHTHTQQMDARQNSVTHVCFIHFPPASSLFSHDARVHVPLTSSCQQFSGSRESNSADANAESMCFCRGDL